ncbi:MAG: hypothetical protein IPO59_14570 [Betaproteobacteria bacterium]|nr:hypothetical protein [Betaproteobacteria bacterium]
MSMLLLVPYAMKVEVETDLLAFFADDHPVNVETRAIESALVGVTTLELSLQGGQRDTFQRVQTLPKGAGPAALAGPTAAGRPQHLDGQPRRRCTGP